MPDNVPHNKIENLNWETGNQAACVNFAFEKIDCRDTPHLAINQKRKNGSHLFLY